MATMLDCGQGANDLLRQLASPSRNRFYYAKLLDVYHLTLEQTYGNSKRWLLNRLTLGTGVLCGVTVSISADKTQARVGAGVVIDGLGREIIVPVDSPPVAVNQPTDECGQPVSDPVTNGPVTLYICYYECEAEPSPVMIQDCCGDRGCENGIIRERYRLRIVAGPPTGPRSSLSDAQCAQLFGTVMTEEERRQFLCNLLGGACGAPTEVCVPLALLTLDANGAVAAVDQCGTRQVIYSNAELLDFILCLAERVDQCCGGGQASDVLQIVSGDAQTAPVGTVVPMPLVVKVTRAGVPVASAPVTFTVATGGGSIGGTATTLGATYATTTAGGGGPDAGTATLPLWQLGATVGDQQVTAADATATPPQVTFHATGTLAPPPPAQLPVVVDFWPPPSATITFTTQEWVGAWRHGPRVEVTFSQDMRPADLDNPATWIRVFLANDVAGPSLLQPLELKRIAVNSPVLKGSPGWVPGPTAGYAIVTPTGGGSLNQATFLVIMRSDSDHIDNVGPPNLMLDADYAGATITAALLDAAWKASGSVPVPAGALTLLTTPPALPSGDGVAGGTWVSWFSVQIG